MRQPPPRGRRPSREETVQTPDSTMAPGLSEPAVRTYMVLCAAALGVILLAQVEQEGGVGSLLLVLVGLLGAIARLRSAPILFLVVLAGQQIVGQLALAGYGPRRSGPAWSPQTSDVVLCGATLAYIVAHYRLQGLVHSVFPVDPRRREGPPRWHFSRLQWLPQVIQERRSPRVVSRVEVGLLVMSLPAAPLLAQVLWAGLAPRWDMLGLLPRLWRFLLLAWILGIGVLVVATVLRQWRRRRMTPAEATLLLQDVVWQGTRREQRRLNRWLAWARLRSPPRKEQS